MNKNGDTYGGLVSSRACIARDLVSAACVDCRDFWPMWRENITRTMLGRESFENAENIIHYPLMTRTVKKGC